MQIEFVNHASFIIEQGHIRLLTDPWLEGYAFHEGWAHTSKTVFSYEDFKNITHIWFSHEHPDHFSPPVLSKIPVEYRKKITILYQKTADKKVADLCRKMKFGNVVELKPEWYFISNDFKIYNKPHSDGDSWICIETPDCRLLNLNDCVIDSDKQLQKIKSITGDIDVLFTQFSYANWAGNKGDRPVRQGAAEEKLKEIIMQYKVIRPKFIIPFASYIWFCHEENFYLNDSVNKINFISDYINNYTSAIPVALYPGDKWDTNNDGHDFKPAMDKYTRDWDTIMSTPAVIKKESVANETLIQNARKFTEDLLKSNSVFINLLKPARIYIDDYNKSYELSLKGGLKAVNVHPDYCDIMLTSGALNYCFKYLWGGSTLRINGRYQIPPHSRFFNFKIYFQISQINNFGKRFDLIYILDQLLRRIKKKIKV